MTSRNMLKHWAQHKARLEYDNVEDISRIHITLRPAREDEEYVFVVCANVIMNNNTVHTFTWPVMDVHSFEEFITQAEASEYFENTIDPQCL